MTSNKREQPMPFATGKPDARLTEGEGVPTDDQRSPISNEPEGPDGKATSGGASKTPKEPFVNPLADRNTEGQRVAGKTPRPTEHPGE